MLGYRTIYDQLLGTTDALKSTPLKMSGSRLQFDGSVLDKLHGDVYWLFRGILGIHFGGETDGNLQELSIEATQNIPSAEGNFPSFQLRQRLESSRQTIAKAYTMKSGTLTIDGHVLAQDPLAVAIMNCALERLEKKAKRFYVPKGNQTSEDGVSRIGLLDEQTVDDQITERYGHLLVKAVFLDDPKEVGKHMLAALGPETNDNAPQTDDGQGVQIKMLPQHGADSATRAQLGEFFASPNLRMEMPFVVNMGEFARGFGAFRAASRTAKANDYLMAKATITDNKAIRQLGKMLGQDFSRSR